MSLLDFRDSAFETIHALASRDPRVYVLTNDMGAQGLDRLRKDFPNQTINVGIAEQNMMSVAAGLAIEGRRVFVYGIIAHIIQRAFEQIKLDICCSPKAVTLVGIGSGLSYGGDGPTHHGNQDLSLTHSMPGMTVYNPADAVTTRAAVRMSYEAATPGYIRLDKEQQHPLYDVAFDGFGDGCCFVLPCQKTNIIATGILVHRAVQAAKACTAKGLPVGVLDLFRTKPLNTAVVDQLIADSDTLVVLEEHTGIGGVSSLIESRIAHATKRPARYRSLCLEDVFFLGCAARPWVQSKCGLLEEQVIKSLQILCARPS